MALVDTPGAADADTYASLVEADAYNATKASWLALTEAEKEAALRMAATLLDAMPAAWSGQGASAEQALGWPRTGMKNRNGYPLASTLVPLELKNAQSEFARQLVEADRLGDNDIVNQYITNVSAGPVSVGFGRRSTEEQGLEVVPDKPSAELAVKLMVPDLVRGMLVASWLLPTAGQVLAGNKTKLLFRNI